MFRGCRSAEHDTACTLVLPSTYGFAPRWFCREDRHEVLAGRKNGLLVVASGLADLDMVGQLGSVR